MAKADWTRKYIGTMKKETSNGRTVIRGKVIIEAAFTATRDPVSTMS